MKHLTDCTWARHRVLALAGNECACRCHVQEPRKPRWLERAGLGKDLTGQVRSVG